jgi:hypothetical protein
MIRLTLAMWAVLLSSCATDELKPPKEHPNWNPVGENTVSAPVGGNVSSAGESGQDRPDAANRYYDGVAASASSLDDGTSSADVIARAAIAENMTNLQEFRRTKVSHIYNQASPITRTKIDGMIYGPPSENDVAQATNIVLMHRKKNQ